MTKHTGLCALLIGAILTPIPAWADLYSAMAAVDKKDYASAFAQFRELAEMGHPVAQESLAVMYVNGEGVKRDNVLGYAWAVMSLENGGGEGAKGIVDQLAPHLTATARASVAELQAQFGREALQKSLFPVRRTLMATPTPAAICTPVFIVDPDDYYPVAARSRGIAGDVIVEMTVFGDGRAHDPRAQSSYPPDVFVVAARSVTLHNKYKTALADGTAVPCVIRIKVKFDITYGGKSGPPKESMDATRERAKHGDPMSQLAYAYVIANRGGSADEEESSIDWYLKAAQAGIPAAQYFVGSYTLSGGLVEKDETKGLLWLNKAANAGSPEAHLKLANYQLLRSPDPAALAAAIDHFGKAVEYGNPEAAYYLAALLATSPDGAVRNPARALELIEKAKDGFGSNPIWLEIRAAAHAAAGDFEKAKKDQAAAVKTANRLGWNTAPQKARLAGYEVGKAWSGDLFAFY